MSNVRLRQLCVTLGANKVIEHLDLDVAEGEFVVLLGPSGCGKSTLLHSIAGLIDVSGGSVEIGGSDMTSADPSARGIGMVFQTYALYPTMSVEKNMSFGLRISGTPKEEITRRVKRAADMLQLGPLLGRKPAQLSGGQRQRVAIGRALVREAGVFLFDEPLSNLDAKLRTELRRELKLLHQRLRSTMIYVTHDQAEAMTLATRIVVMRAGKVQQIGSPSSVYDLPANLFVAGFLGSPPMNLIAGALDDASEFASASVTLDMSAYPFAQATSKPGAAVLGVRPEHIAITDTGELSGTVTLVEPMGNHQIVWVAVGDEQLCALVHDGREHVAGAAVRLSINSARASLFDPATEQRL